MRTGQSGRRRRGRPARVAGWNGMALRTARTAEALPALALLHTCIYNAWAAYDDAARQTVLGVAMDGSAAAAEALRRFTGGSLLDAAASEAGRKVGALVFDKARRYWQGTG